jgi:DNA-binding response OmpR family regulator
MNARLRVLVAEDDRVSAAMLTSALERWQFDVTSVGDGDRAWQLMSEGKFPLAIVDWMMPGLDGPALCKRIRLDETTSGAYVIMLTSKEGRDDLVEGLNAGADDYLRKPFDREELRARIQVGARVAMLQQGLRDKVVELETALRTITNLEGLLPICSYCKRIRSEDNTWNQVESYIRSHSNAEISHGVCPSCMERVLQEIDGAPPGR